MADSKGMDDSVLEDLRQSFQDFRQDNTASDLVLVAAHRCVDNGCTKGMTDTFLNPENKDVLEYIGWELIGLLSKLNEQINEEHNIKLLDAIAQTCSPKEVCLGIVEQMDAGLSTPVFETLLGPLQTAFSKLKGRKSKFLKMVVPQMSRHVRMIQFPDDEDEDYTVDRSHSKPQLSLLLNKVMGLIDFLIDDTGVSKTPEKTNNENHASEETQTWELVKCLIGLLEALALENLTSETRDDASEKESDDITSSQSYKDHAMKILTLLSKLHYTAITLMEYASSHSSFCDNEQNKSTKSSADEEHDDIDNEDPLSDDTDAEVLPLLGLGCLSYLLLAERVDTLRIQQVFRFDYLLKINLECISCLLQRTSMQINHKGLELLSSLLEKIEDDSLEHYFLKYPRFLDITKALINVMVYGTSKPLRKQATSLLVKLIAKPNTRGRYVLLRYLLLDCSHAGVAALLIHSIKEEVHRNLNCEKEDTWFRGTQLISLLRRVCKGVGTEMDLVPETERIMASLNCFRYILLRDREDETTLWKNYTMFEKDFLDPLRESIKVTRARYLALQQQKEDETKRAASVKRKEDTEKKIDFTVTTPDGTPINEMSQDDQIQVLRSGLYALDMMDCIIAHVADIVNSRS